MSPVFEILLAAIGFVFVVLFQVQRRLSSIESDMKWLKREIGVICHEERR